MGCLRKRVCARVYHRTGREMRQIEQLFWLWSDYPTTASNIGSLSHGAPIVSQFLPGKIRQINRDLRLYLSS